MKIFLGARAPPPGPPSGYSSALKKASGNQATKHTEKLEEFVLQGVQSVIDAPGMQLKQSVYSDEINVTALKSKIHLYKNMFESDPKSFNDVCNQLRDNKSVESVFISNILNICELILVNLATSASAECSFSNARVLCPTL